MSEAARMQRATSRPPQVIGIHFVNPVPVLSLVELAPSLLTADASTRGWCVGRRTIRTPPRLARMVEAGPLGRKSKRGFYTYG